jgi:succinate dehydrogenase / fumarate reductase cytochrome b subunit
MSGSETASGTPSASLCGSLASTLGGKTVVALTGLSLLGFVLAHMAGNLQIYLGQEAVNAYAAKLKSLGGLLWAARLGLLAVAVLHVVTALKLAAHSRTARPVRYAASGSVQKTVSAASMVWSGLLIAAFVVYHLAHFTWGWILTDAYALRDAQGRHDVYSMTVLGFQQPLIAGLYLFAMVVLALHLVHGAQSIFQTLGVTRPHTAAAIRKAGLAVAWLVLLGNASMPLAVLAGLVTLPAGAGS